MSENIQYLSFFCWVNMKAKNQFDMKIPTSTIYSMSAKHQWPRRMLVSLATQAVVLMAQ